MNKNLLQVSGTKRKSQVSNARSSCGSVIPFSSDSDSSISTVEKVRYKTIKACFIPREENIQEEDWLLENIAEFYNTVYLKFSELSCNIELWDNIEYPKGVKFLWQVKPHEKPVVLRPYQYIEEIFRWIDSQITNEDLFPQDISKPFPADCKKHLTRICRRLFRVYAIILYNEKIFGSKILKYLKSSFRHFLFFCWIWDVLQIKAISNIYDVEVYRIHKLFNNQMKRINFISKAL